MATPIPQTLAAFELAEVAAVTGGKRRGPGIRCVGVSTDTRLLRPGELFVALRGESFDGHRFVEAAFAAGAAAAVVEDASALPGGAPGVIVDDGLVALGELALAHRARMDVEVVAITGSAGKTSTKELVADTLAGAGRHVLRTRGNLNNRIGLPLTLLGLTSEHDTAVVELGTSEAGEIERLTRIARPDVGVLTLVAAAHTEGLGGIEEVAAEKGAMLAGLRSGAVAVANGDDAFARGALERSPAGRRVLFGRGDGCDVRLVSADLLAELVTLVVYELPGEPRFLSVRLPLLGEAGAMNAAGALAVGRALGVAPSACASALAAATPVPGRLAIPDPRATPLILDDTYNSNPRSLELSLRAAARLAEARGGRLVAVLGDMLELGARAPREHATICSLVGSLGARSFVAVGPRMTRAQAEAGASLRRVGTWAVERAEDAVAPALERAEARDVVLVKGSRGMTMERALPGLLEGRAP